MLMGLIGSGGVPPLEATEPPFEAGVNAEMVIFCGAPGAVLERSGINELLRLFGASLNAQMLKLVSDEAV